MKKFDLCQKIGDIKKFLCEFFGGKEIVFRLSSSLEKDHLVRRNLVNKNNVFIWAENLKKVLFVHFFHFQNESSNGLGEASTQAKSRLVHCLVTKCLHDKFHTKTKEIKEKNSPR